MLNYISKPFRWFFKLEAASGLLLLISAIIALLISNSDLSDIYFETFNRYIFIGINNFGLKLSVLHWINDALMAIFFFFVTLEIKREFLQGELSSLKQAILPIVGAVGGMVVPAAIYIYIMFFGPKPWESVYGLTVQASAQKAIFLIGFFTNWMTIKAIGLLDDKV